MSESRAEAARERSGGEEAELIRGKRREADRRGEEPKKKMPATSQTVLGVFLHCIAFRVRPCGGLAQLGERVLCKHEVVGSSPISSTSFSSEKHTAFGLIAQLVRAHA